MSDLNNEAPCRIPPPRIRSIIIAVKDLLLLCLILSVLCITAPSCLVTVKCDRSYKTKIICTLPVIYIQKFCSRIFTRRRRYLQCQTCGFLRKNRMILASLGILIIAIDAELADGAEMPPTLTLSWTSDSGYYGAMYSYLSCYMNCTL